MDNPGPPAQPAPFRPVGPTAYPSAETECRQTVSGCLVRGRPTVRFC